MTRLFLSLCLAWLTALPMRAEVTIQQVTSPGGITAWLVEEHSIPFTALELRFQGGTSLDAPDRRGAINLMMALIEEGAGEMNSQQFAAAREALAADFSFDAFDDSVRVSARFLSENQGDAVELLRQALIETRFDDDAVARVREQVLANLRSDAQDPQELANLAFDAAAFGDHPYGSSSSGTLQSVVALNRDDMIDAQARVMVRDGLFVGAVGDITPRQLGRLLDDLLGDLPQSGAPYPGPTDFLPAGGISVVPFDTPQSVAIFGQAGIARDDDDFFAAFVMNQILGAGGFGSRLTREVRENRGLTYGISSFLVMRDYSDLLMGQVASANDRMAETIDVVRAEWRRMADSGVSDDELRDAITYLTGAYPLRFDGNGRIANILAGMQMQGLGIDYINTRNDRVAAVTSADISRVAARLLSADDLFFVVVGQPVGLEGATVAE